MRLPAHLLVPDPDEVIGHCSGTLVIGALELVEIEHALSAGERSRAAIAEDFGVATITIKRIAKRMIEQGRAVRSLPRDAGWKQRRNA